MGIDCRLITDEENVSLDRLYVFDTGFNPIHAGKEYPKEEFVSLLHARLNVLSDTYSRYWLEFAVAHSGERNMILDERTAPNTLWFAQKLS